MFETEPDNLGITYHGPVLTGLRGLKQELRIQALAAAPQPKPPDPVSCLHGTIEVDPVYARQRQELGNRPDLCDPVIRHHLNLPPLQDRYEILRRNAEDWARERPKHLVK